MSADSPNKVLLRTIKQALKTWLREVRRTSHPRRTLRRGAAAAAAVTLAAGMSAVPASAALPDPSTDNHPQSSTQPDGVRVAQMMEELRPERDERIEPDPLRPPPLDYNRWRAPGELDPDTAQQLRDYENAPKILERFDEIEKKVEEGLQEHDQEPAEKPGLLPFPNIKLDNQWDQVMRDLADQENAIRAAAEADRQPPGYLNEFHIGRDMRFQNKQDADVAEDMDRQAIRDQLDRSFLFNEMFTDDERNRTKAEFYRLISFYYNVDWNPELRDMAIDDYNKAVDEFNRAELEARDMYDGHRDGDRVTPRPPLPERRPADIPVPVKAEQEPDNPRPDNEDDPAKEATDKGKLPDNAPIDTPENPTTEPDDTPTDTEPGTDSATADEDSTTDNQNVPGTTNEPNTPTDAEPGTDSATADNEDNQNVPGTTNEPDTSTDTEPGTDSSTDSVDSTDSETDSNPSSTSPAESTMSESDTSGSESESGSSGGDSDSSSSDSTDSSGGSTTTFGGGSDSGGESSGSDSSSSSDSGGSGDSGSSSGGDGGGD